jgi:hypothetical protein
MVPTMAFPARIRRYRGSKRRVARIRFSTTDKWYAALLGLLAVCSIAAGAWLGFHL